MIMKTVSHTAVRHAERTERIIRYTAQLSQLLTQLLTVTINGASSCPHNTRWTIQSMLWAMIYDLFVITDFDLDNVLFELQRVKFPAEKWKSLANGLRLASAVPTIESWPENRHRQATSTNQSMGEENDPTQPVDHIGWGYSDVWWACCS